MTLSQADMQMHAVPAHQFDPLMLDETLDLRQDEITRLRGDIAGQDQFRHTKVHPPRRIRGLGPRYPARLDGDSGDVRNKCAGQAGMGLLGQVCSPVRRRAILKATPCGSGWSF